MNYFSDWNQAIVASLQNLWNKVIAFIPELVAALVVLIVGLLIAHFLSKLVYKLIMLTQVDKLIHKIDAVKKMHEMGTTVSFAGILAWVVKWFFIVVTLIAAADILHLTQVNVFLDRVVYYLPNVVVAIVILAIGLVVGQFVYDVVDKSTKTSKLTAHTSHTLAAIAKWALIVFALLASLVQLGVADKLIETLFTGFIAMLALAFGLAFGLGGKEAAARWVEKVSMKK